MSETVTHRGPVLAVLPDPSDLRTPGAVADPDRHMVDSAYPLGGPPAGGWRDIILIYAGGDTPHPWTTADILSMPARYRFPCWVRSDPQGAAEGAAEAAAFIAWLRSHHVPQNTCVILDLETAAAAAYVAAFNLVMRAALYHVVKYGSEGNIWLNPKTDGGTYVAEPGSDVLTTKGDTVARQYAFDGGYDLSITMGQDRLPLWDTYAQQPVLSYGATGPWVITLQKRLNVHGAVPPLAVDGDFGPDTEKAVQAFQKTAKLAPDGVVGPLTWAALSKP